METVADTIKKCTKEHLLQRQGLLFAQCVRAVGWIGGTVPELTEEQGIIELPTSDCSNGGIVCGAALMGRMPIYVVRYQGFMWYNAVSIVNYAAKSKEIWDQDCPVFVRAIGMDGGVGPVASNMNHSIIAHMPGIDVFAPMTPMEWQMIWTSFLHRPRPIYCSEHRLSFTNSKEINNLYKINAQWNIIHIGPSRLYIESLDEELEKCGIIANHISAWKLAPLDIEDFNTLLPTLIVDDDYTTCGMSEHIAYILNIGCDMKCYVLGLESRTAGFSKEKDNKYPSNDKIIKFIKDHI